MEKRLVFSLLIVSVVLLSCSREKNPLKPNVDKEFAIYVSVDAQYGSYNLEIEKISLQDSPLLKSSDIDAYIWAAHEIIYSESMYERLSQRTDLLHKVFVVTVGKERIYWGLFQSLADSYACPNPVIFLTPRLSNRAYVLPNSIIVHRSYFDGGIAETGPDPRTDKRIFDSFKKAGKLIE